jgi:hypothetical protein
VTDICRDAPSDAWGRPWCRPSWPPARPRPKYRAEEAEAKIAAAATAAVPASLASYKCFDCGFHHLASPAFAVEMAEEAAARAEATEETT